MDDLFDEISHHNRLIFYIVLMWIYPIDLQYWNNIHNNIWRKKQQQQNQIIDYEFGFFAEWNYCKNLYSQHRMLVILVQQLKWYAFYPSHISSIVEEILCTGISFRTNTSNVQTVLSLRQMYRLLFKHFSTFKYVCARELASVILPTHSHSRVRPQVHTRKLIL